MNEIIKFDEISFVSDEEVMKSKEYKEMFEEVKENCHFVSSRNGGNGGFAQIIYYVNK